MATVKEMARSLGWRVYHTHDSRRSDPGFPDLLCIRGPHLLAFELKSERGKPTPEQEAWIAAFKGVKIVDADVVYPRHLDQIEDVLRRAAR